MQSFQEALERQLRNAFVRVGQRHQEVVKEKFVLEKLLWSIDGGKHPEKRSELLLERSSTEIITRPTKTVWFECDDDAKGKNCY